MIARSPLTAALVIPVNKKHLVLRGGWVLEKWCLVRVLIQAQTIFPADSFYPFQSSAILRLRHFLKLNHGIMTNRKSFFLPASRSILHTSVSILERTCRTFEFSCTTIILFIDS